MRDPRPHADDHTERWRDAAALAPRGGRVRPADAAPRTSTNRRIDAGMWNTRRSRRAGVDARRGGARGSQQQAREQEEFR